MIMNTLTSETLDCSLLSLGCVFGVAPHTDLTLTALRGLNISQRRLRPEVRAQLLSITSARTDITFTPDAWRFGYRDEKTVSHCRVVTVAARASSEHPDTVGAFSSLKPEDAPVLSPIPQDSLLVDSREALAKVRAISKLKGILSAQYRLLQPGNGPEPVWTLSFYGKADETLASFCVGAKSGATRLAPVAM